MSKIVAITGTSGRLGGALKRYFRGRGWSVLTLNRSVLDFTQPDLIAPILEELSFDALIHPAAITGLEECESNPEQAMMVNATAPGLVAAHCAQREVPMLHVSTDCVFSGLASGLRCESDLAEPINAYGQSKRAGEQAVLVAHPSAWVARVSWLFGPDKASFVESMLDRAERGEAVQAVADKFSTPSYTQDLCQAFEGLLGLPEKGGIIHACNRGQTTWHGYAQEVFRLAGKPEVNIEPLALSEMTTFVAERPIHTAMDPSKLEGLLGRFMRSWQDALADYFTSKV